jgi:hypothetical protein
MTGGGVAVNGQFWVQSRYLIGVTGMSLPAGWERPYAIGSHLQDVNAYL